MYLQINGEKKEQTIPVSIILTVYVQMLSVIFIQEIPSITEYKNSILPENS
jgi:hypothetical protein